MKQVVICHPELKASPGISILQKEIFEMEGIDVHCALIEKTYPESFFNQEFGDYFVLVKKSGFTCNYRDKANILTAAAKYAYQAKSKKGQGHSAFTGIGSDYVAEIIRVGKAVEEFKVGDRVINNGSYPDRFDVGSLRNNGPIGLPTNWASDRYEWVHSDKLMRIPKEMTLDVAAGFTIGAQTSYGMLRKLQIRPGSNVLLTAAKSNTSLFVLQALSKRRDVNIYLASTSEKFKDRLIQYGIKDYFLVDDSDELFISSQLHKVPSYGFDVVIDPMHDIYFSRVLRYMAIGGKYITCGLQNQYAHITKKQYSTFDADLNSLMSWIMIRSIHVMGNCLGLDVDLASAVKFHCQGQFPVLIDGSLSYEDSVASFFQRTYLDKNRFGKVVFRYD